MFDYIQFSKFSTLLMHSLNFVLQMQWSSVIERWVLFMHFDTSCGARVDRYVDVSASRHSRESACFLAVNRQCGSWMDY